MFKYFFALGNHPDISVAEITTVLDSFQIKYVPETIKTRDVFVVITETNIDVASLIKRLGGTIKIGIIESSCTPSQDYIIEAISKLSFPKKETKLNFGISYYGKKKLDQKRIGMETKRVLKEQGYHCRWVTSREKTLSSVVVEQNGLVGKGIEIVLIDCSDNILVGRTLAVQPFKELSDRDYGRPARDDASGMLPPKLAQIMINLAGADMKATILDPFCGSGTVLMEAALMGYKKIIGSDLSIKAVKDSLRNIEWAKEKYGLDQEIRLFNTSATEISKSLKVNSVDAIVTEPYLGPQQGFTDLDKTKRELDELYTKALREFRKVLKTGGKVVMIWPILNKDKRQVSVTPRTDGYEIMDNKLIYKREGQRVWRRIAILKKV